MVRGSHAVDAFSAERLLQARRRAGISQEELARRIIGTRPELSADKRASAVTTERLKILAYEAGRRRPRASALHTLARVLDLQPLDLVDPEVPVTLELVRALHNLTQGQVARELGISQARYSQIEAGLAVIEPDRAAHLAALLDLTVEQITTMIHARDPRGE